MLTTVKATVEGERIEWQEDMEKMLPPNQRVDVLVTILQADSNEASVEERARRRVAALERLAAGIRSPLLLSPNGGSARLEKIVTSAGGNNEAAR